MIEVPGIVRDPLYLYSALVGWLRRRPRRGGVRRILIYKLDHIGDLLMATPALRAIRRHHPDAEITLVIGEWNLPIIEGNRNIDRTIVFNSPRFTRPPHTPGRHRDLRRALAGYRPDLVIGLRDDWSTLTSSLFSGAQRLERGSSHLREWLSRRRSGAPQFHELERIWGMLRPAGIEPAEDPWLELVLRTEEREEALRFMREEGIEPGFIAIQVGSASAMREWEVSRFAEVARDRVASGEGGIVLVGAPSERERSRELRDMIADLRPIDITGRRSLRQLGALLEHAGLYLGSDGGAVHIATAVGTPTVVLFGPGAYHVFHPVGPNVSAISHHFPCSPCTQTICIHPEATCMQAITVEEVVAGIEELRRGGEGVRG
jgi:ADP-heptose:LPS heptosyltransferase